MMDDKRRDWVLLRQFVDKNSQEAFRELTSRYMGLVFGTALRELGDRAMAEDVTQAVFLILSRKAPTFRPNIVLAAWLFDTCKFTVKNAQRTEQRRLIRDQRMAIEIQQVRESQVRQGHGIADGALNDALSNLSKPDRQAVLLRFVCGYSLKETGEVFGISENTARIRVYRALEKLRRNLTKAGIGLSAIAVAALLETRAAEAASSGLEAKIVDLVVNHSTAPLEGVTAHAIAQGALKSMSIVNLKIAAAITCGLVLAGGMVHQGIAQATHAIVRLMNAQTAPTPQNIGYKPIASVASASDPRAIALFKKMIDAYAAIKTCSFTETAVNFTQDGMPYTMHAKLEPPEKYEIRITRRGNTSRIVYQDAKVYIIPEKDPAHFNTLNILNNQIPLAGGMSSAASVHSDFIPILIVKELRDSVLGPDFFKANELLMGRQSVIDNTPVDTLIMRDPHPDGSFTTGYFAIGHDDHLMRRITGPAETYTINFTDIKINQPIPPETFRFTPPRGG